MEMAAVQRGSGEKGGTNYKSQFRIFSKGSRNWTGSGQCRLREGFFFKNGIVCLHGNKSTSKGKMAMQEKMNFTNTKS